MPLPTLLPISLWTEKIISFIYEAKSQADTNDAIDSFLSKDAVITVNGKNISCAEFSKELQFEKFLEQQATVTFLNTVEVPADKFSLQEAGSVGTFFTVTIQEIIRVRDAPVSHKVTASLNVDIEQDLSIPVPAPSKFPVFFDRRRAKALNLVILDTPVPIIVPIVPPGPTGN